MSIASFYIGVLTGIFFEYKIINEMESMPLSPGFEIIGIIGCVFICLIGLLWTYYPYKCFLTLDVRYNMYGIEVHEKRCDILAKKKYIICIFKFFGIAFPSNKNNKKKA